ncbi:MAG: hypothetical protein ACK56I_20750, partial [bacterium]
RQTPRFLIEFSPETLSQLLFLESFEQNFLRPSIQTQLEFDPVNVKKKRLEIISESASLVEAELSLRTWRVLFQLNRESQKVYIARIRSGYTETDVLSSHDPYLDKEVHRLFLEKFRGAL